ncbi:MAG: AAA family ATPase [Alphaproteobacteria bacterium]|nr:AAA family ATPase [Alphaproteobacteria bacterium]
MIKQISIVQYRKLKTLDVEFIQGLNFISGANGTCKSSLLHIISNSFQCVVASSAGLTDKNCFGVIKGINASLNPKIEALTKGDKKYNEPANGIKGTLFTVEYINDLKLSFRRHNSKLANRYALKPKYSKGTTDKLPALPAIYLGLTRLYPFGEFNNETEIKKLNHKLPQKYQEELIRIYDDLTRIKISSTQPQRIGYVKSRHDFDSQTKGVDANTISAGEDNVFIILTALISLKYYYESLQFSTRAVESVLLMDEFDATLHPALQIKLLEVVRCFSRQYKIQCIFTTHSLSLLEYSIRQGDNVIYLIDNISKIDLMKDPDIFKIKMDLKTIARKDIYADKKIPIFMEDEEARTFLTAMFDYWQGKDEKFKRIRNNFHLVEAPLGCDALRHIFGDKKLLPIMRAICVLDGDQSKDMGNYIIALPGKASPEKLLLEYAETLYNASNDSFWRQEEVEYSGYNKKFYSENVQLKYNTIKNKISDLKEEGKSTKGVLREKLKELWKENAEFIDLVLKEWLNDPNNKAQISQFMRDLNTMFRKTALYHGINNRDWDIATEGNHA